MRIDWRYIFEVVIVLLACFYNWNQGYKKGLDVGFTQSGAIIGRYLYDTDSKGKFDIWAKQFRLILEKKGKEDDL